MGMIQRHSQIFPKYYKFKSVDNRHPNILIPSTSSQRPHTLYKSPWDHIIVDDTHVSYAEAHLNHSFLFHLFSDFQP